MVTLVLTEDEATIIRQALVDVKIRSKDLDDYARVYIKVNEAIKHGS